MWRNVHRKEKRMQTGNKSLDKTDCENPLIRHKIFGHVTKNGEKKCVEKDMKGTSRTTRL
jgi:hypothetical protein